MNISLLPIIDDYACCIYERQKKWKLLVKNTKRVPSLQINRVYDLINESHNIDPERYIKLKNYRKITKTFSDL